MTMELEQNEDFYMWDKLGLKCASYSSLIDWHVIQVMKLLAVRDPFPSSQTIAEALDLPEAYIELIHYILCSADLCEYGTSPRSCWPEDDKKFQEFITSCELYYKRVWESDGK